ncbi:hypothetical protein D3C73_1030580 [compost metagenome]
MIDLIRGANLAQARELALHLCCRQAATHRQIKISAFTLAQAWIIEADLPAVVAVLLQRQGDHTRRQAGLQQRGNQTQQWGEHTFQMLMPVSRDLVDIVFQGKGQQAAGQLCQFPVHRFGMPCRVRLEICQDRLVGVQGVEQPEQRHIGHGKIGHALVTFTTQAHQPLTLGGQLGQQIIQLRQQSRVSRKIEQWRHISVIQPPCALPVPHQAHDRAGQVIGVVVVGKTQAQHVFQHADLLRLAFVQILHLAPVLAITRRSLDLAVIEQAVVAIGLFQRQGQ